MFACYPKRQPHGDHVTDDTHHSRHNPGKEQFADIAQRTPELQHAVATHIHDLCALAIGTTRDATEIAKGRGLRAARLRAVKADIVQNLQDGDVSVTALAARHRIGIRYIQRLFESERTTL